MFFTYLICFTLIFFSAFTEESTSNNPLNIVEQVEKNLIYSKDIVKEPKEEGVVIKKGKWNEDTTKELENISNEETEKKIKASIKKTKKDKSAVALKRQAYESINLGQYEVAVKLYKEALKLNKNDAYAKLGLATAYQYLGQYSQSKPLYLEVLEIFPNDQQIMSNLLFIVTEETPYEAVYLLSSIADKNSDSALLQSQASLAYTKIKNYPKAIEYIQKAIQLDSENISYYYNLAVLYDLNNNYQQALYSYNALLRDYSSSSLISLNVPVEEIKSRIKTLNAIVND